MNKTKYIDGLSQIISASNINEDIFFQFTENLKSKKRILIYGAGNWGTWLFSVLKSYSINIYAFLDLKAESIVEIDNTPVFDPSSSSLTANERQSMSIVIATNYLYHDEIKQNLYQLGYRDINTIDCLWYLGHLSFDNSINSLIHRSNDFLDCAKILEDEKSLQIYIDAISSYTSLKCITSIAPELDNQYFPKDIPFSKGYSRFIDCGAYNGDTIMQLNKTVGLVDTIIAFESDYKNFTQLTQTLKNCEEKIANRILLYPCAVWNKLKQLNFHSDQGAGGVISKNGKSFVQGVALDDAVSDFSPTFIKMDIEGAEYQALLGAEKLIKAYKPDLAICVYHSIIDFCTIPLLINSWNLGYKLYLRCHQKFNQEIVLYAISTDN